MASFGKLYLVATPIGNLEDITLRAIRILQTVDKIAAEDTRHTGKLLQHFQITTPQISYHQHNHKKRLDNLLGILQKGENIALVTDAGMPGISDPGYDLIKEAIAAHIEVIPIPGVTAAITALAASGLPTERFIFEGFLPHKPKDRNARLNQLQSETRTLIFYESPHHLPQTLSDLATTLGKEREIVIARELTKLYEQFWRGTISEAQTYYSQNPPKGEFTLIVAGNQPTNLLLSETEILAELEQLLQQGLTRSQASRIVAESSYLSRRQIYQLALSLNKAEELRE